MAPPALSSVSWRTCPVWQLLIVGASEISGADLERGRAGAVVGSETGAGWGADADMRAGASVAGEGLGTGVMAGVGALAAAGAGSGVPAAALEPPSLTMTDLFAGTRLQPCVD